MKISKLCVCLECGVHFVGRTRAQGWCSPECRRIGYNKNRAAYKRSRARREQRVCPRCARHFEVRVYRSEGARPGKFVFCPECRTLPYAEKYPLNERVCAECGKSFSRRRRFCSDACAKEAERKRRRPPREVTCAECGRAVTFVGRHFYRYCSDKCREAVKNRRKNKRRRGAFPAKARKRARVYGVDYEPVNRRKVFERDGYRCQICGHQLAKKDVGKSKSRAPTLDHRVPMANGGGHTYENCQTACSICNSEKSNFSSVGQLPLVAQI